MKIIRRFCIYDKCKTFVDGGSYSGFSRLFDLYTHSELFSRCYFHSFNDGYNSCLNFGNRINSNIFKTDW